MTGTRDRLLEVLDRLVHQLIVCLVQFDLSGERSAQRRAVLEEFDGALREAFDAGLASPLRLQLHDGHVAVGRLRLIGASLQAGRLLRVCRELGIRELSFAAGVGRDEVERFLHVMLAPDARDAFRPDNLPRALQAHGIERIGVRLQQGGLPHLMRAEAEAATPPVEPPAGEVVPDAGGLRSYQDLADLVTDNHVAAKAGEGLSIDRALGVVEAAVKQLDSSPSGLLALATYDDIDRFTVGHSVRVALLAMQVARVGGASEQSLLRLGTAALLHDVGKSRVPQEILFKQGRLTDDEFALMAEHPLLGAEILVEQPDLDPAVIGAAFCHHMSPGGRGYPRPAVAFEPSEASKLVRVCDVFEALTAVRPYKQAMSPLEAYTVMFRDEQGFDRRWLHFFVQAMGLFPVGSRVALDDDSLAVVTATGRRPDRPWVRLLTGPDCGPVLDGMPLEVRVGDERPDGTRWRIASLLGPSTSEEGATRTVGHCCLDDDEDSGNSPSS